MKWVNVDTTVQEEAVAFSTDARLPHGKIRRTPVRDSLFPSVLLICLLTAVQGKAAVESIPLPTSRWVTPVRLISIATPQGPGVTLEYEHPCLAEAGNRLRPLVHNFGKRGFVLMQYRTPYSTMEGQCPDRTLFFLREKEVPPATP